MTSDVVLRPRPESAFLDPFAERPTLVVRCGHLGRDGRPLPQSPDTILRSACARLETELGVEPTALGEVEYFLGKPHAPSDIYGADADGVLWEQHEIELALQPLPDAADSILLTQWVLRMLARREGMRCSTEPMMLAGHAGRY